MHEIKAKAQDLCQLKEKILDWTKAKLCDDSIGIEQAGQLIDMVKDLCEAEKDIYKAAYYCEVTSAMKEYDEEEGRMGYDHYRYSSGRYAPKGKGTWTPIHGGRAGYPWPAEGDWRPEFDKGHMMGDEMHSKWGKKMGYIDPDMEHIMSDEKHGRPYKDWKLARRHYTETKSEGDKFEMSEHAKEHMADTVMTVKEMWQEADPQLRDKMKKDLMGLLNEMK